MRRLLVVPVLAIGLVATPASASTHHRYLTQSDTGRTIHVVVGDKISVRLPGGSGGGYHRPRSSNEANVDRVWSTGGYPGDADAQANFIARHTGKADLTATTDYPCLHTNPRCEIAQRIWIVHVVVG